LSEIAAHSADYQLKSALTQKLYLMRVTVMKRIVLANYTNGFQNLLAPFPKNVITKKYIIFLPKCQEKSVNRCPMQIF
jgi:hypothetical protein